ncbi:hypothetical protein H0H93_013205 [Arthromyces matolae]|nr:hypothetical protein H0H93_013205 [Arthromyces matolae]
MPLHLPPEVYCVIFRLATNVDEALDTSFDTVQEENRDVLLPRIRDSIRFKATLSVVSKEFRWIMDTILYEIILITRFPFVPILLDRLRSNLYGSSRPKGHACRRLDIHLGTWGDAGYVDETWYEGGHTFWGLIPACPRLEILTARINYRKPGDKYLGPPHLTHNALWKTISTYCASTLRRLELFGFTIRLDRIELMLRYMSNLEVCDISHCASFEVRDLPERYIRRQKELKPQIFDEEEPGIRRLKVELPSQKVCCRSMLRHSEVIQSRHDLKYKERCNSFSQSHLDEFEEAELNATWPPPTGDGPPYLLPKLHTLRFSLFTDRFFLFTFPSLKYLHIDFLASDAYMTFEPYVLLFHINPTATYIAYGGLIPVSSKSDLKVGKVHDNHIVLKHPSKTKTRMFKMKVKYYPQPESNGTLFGSFPDSLTHLRVAHLYLPLSKVLHFFPNLTNLTWCDPWHHEAYEVPAGANIALRLVNMETPACIMDPTSMEEVLQQLLDSVKNARLLCLKEVKIHIGTDYHPLFQEFSARGESLGIRVTTVPARPRGLENLNYVVLSS